MFAGIYSLPEVSPDSTEWLCPCSSLPRKIFRLGSETSGTPHDHTQISYCHQIYPYLLFLELILATLLIYQAECSPGAPIRLSLMSAVQQPGFD